MLAAKQSLKDITSHNFVQDCLSGYTTPDKIDDYVSTWHKSSSTEGLREFLGFTETEYAEWLINPNILLDILCRRK